LEEAPIWRLLLGEGLRNEPTVLPVGRQLLDVLHPGLTAWIGAAIPEIAQPDAAANVVLGAMFTGFITHIFDPDRATADLESELADVVLVLLESRAPRFGRGWRSTESFVASFLLTLDCHRSR
jgi:hypothetical protein